ncbi:MAG: DUF2383 domain-containing protein [Bacteriovoracaceae bacterium]
MKHIDELIRGEMAAVKSIDVVLHKLKDTKEKDQLMTLRNDHEKAVQSLKRYVSADFKEDVQSSGPWGSFTKAFVGGASFFGDRTALQALKVGEEHGVNEYKQALADSSIQQDLRNVIQNELLPNQEKHIQLIGRYLH